MIRIAVCDDEKSQLNDTVSLLELWSARTGNPVQIDSFTDGDSLIERNAAAHYNIILLDIMMPLLNGIDTAKELRTNDNTVMLIFLTSSPEYALESYAVKAQDYIIKPISYDKLKKMMDDCCSALYTEPASIVVRVANGYRKLYKHEIEYVEAQNKKVVFHLLNNIHIESYDPFHTYEEKLNCSTGFFKCHRSYIVYLPNVEFFTQAEAVTKGGIRIPIARGLGKAFQEAYFNVMFG